MTSSPAVDSRLLLSDPKDGTPLFKHTSIDAPYPCVRRSSIERADYNPRVMNAAAKKELRERLQKYGLVNRLVWNSKTGVLVGGHQRLEQMDKLQGYPAKCEDYLIPVDVVNLDVAKEKEVNILLNNTNQQGTWDENALASMFKDGDVNPFDAGFNKVDLEFMLGGEQAAKMVDLFGQDIGGEITAEQRLAERAKADTSKDGQGDMQAIQQEADKINEIKERRREGKAADQQDDSPDHVLHIVFNGPRELRGWLEDNGYPKDTRYIVIERLDALISEAIEIGIANALEDPEEGEE